MLALGGSGFQPFVVPTRRAGEKVSVDSDASGSMGIGMSEKDIDERVRVLCFFHPCFSV
jgi:hypothetical protein